MKEIEQILKDKQRALEELIAKMQLNKVDFNERASAEILNELIKEQVNHEDSRPTAN